MDCVALKFSWIRTAKPKAMNTVILTHGRIFLSAVGPSGSGKIEIIFKMLRGSTFYTKVDYFTFTKNNNLCSLRFKKR